MKRKSTLLTALILMCSIFQTQAQQITWIKHYPVAFPAASEARDVIELNNSYYSIAQAIYTGASTVMQLVRLNYQGDTMFVKTIIPHPSQWIVPRRMTPTTDGGMVITGVQFCNTFLLKLDSLGNIVWNKTYEDLTPSDCDDMFGVSSVHDGGFIATGFDQTTGDIKVMRFDANGDSLWMKLFPVSGSGVGNYVEQTRDSNFLVSATINGGPASGQSYIMKLNQSGDTLWTKTIGIVALNSFQNFCMTRELNDSSLTMFMLKESKFTLRHMNQYGDSLWENVMSNLKQVARSMELTSDGGYIMTGDSLYPYPSYDYSAIKIVKADASGNVMWKQNINLSGFNNLDRGYKVIETSDHGYLVAGRSNVLGSAEAVFIKLDSLGNFITALNEPLSSSSLRVYPNPLTNKLNISFHNNELSKIVLYDISSRKVFEDEFINFISLNTEQLEKGIYLYEVRGKNGLSIKGKVVKD